MHHAREECSTKPRCLNKKNEVKFSFNQDKPPIIQLMPHKHYEKVQPILFRVGTTNFLNYNALRNDETDAKKRCGIIHEVLLMTRFFQEIDQDPNCLKVFVVPEFFFRGTKGGYPVDIATKLVEDLRETVKHSIYRDWMFVFGTMVAYAEKDLNLNEKEQPRNGHVQNEDERARTNNGIMKNAHEAQRTNNRDQNENESEASDISLEEDNTHHAYNFSFVQVGDGAEKDSLIVLKEHKSWIDFVMVSRRKSILKSNDIDYLKPVCKQETRNEKKRFRYDGNSIFEVGGLRVGIEICKDHTKNRLSLNAPKEDIDLHIIVSGGLLNAYASKNLREKGVFCHCDGLTAALEHEAKVQQRGMDNVMVPLSVKRKTKYNPTGTKKNKLSQLFSSCYGYADIYESVSLQQEKKFLKQSMEMKHENEV